jgi:hypothetical protein
MLPHATGFEYLFVTVMAIGALCNAWCVWDAVQDRRAVVSLQECTEAAWIVAHANVRSEWIACSLSVAFTGLGVLSLFSPEAVHRHDPPILHALRVSMVLLLVGSAFALAMGAMLNMRDRRRILEVFGMMRPRP